LYEVTTSDPLAEDHPKFDLELQLLGVTYPLKRVTLTKDPKYRQDMMTLQNFKTSDGKFNSPPKRSYNDKLKV